MDIKILTDTAADLDKPDLDKYGIGLLSFRSLFGDEVYKTGVDITKKEFFEKLSEIDYFPTTSQTPPAEMYEIFKKETTEHDAVIYIALSSKASGQYNTALMLREQLLEENPNAKLYLIDTQGFSLQIGMSAIYATELVEQGLDAEEIVVKVEEYIKKWHIMLLVSDLKWLEKGGRIKKSTAILGSMLDIKPIIGSKDGLMCAEGKIRGNKKIPKKLLDAMEANGDMEKESPEFLVLNSDEKLAEEFCSELKSRYGEESLKMSRMFDAIVGTHVGTGALGFIYKTK